MFARWPWVFLWIFLSNCDDSFQELSVIYENNFENELTGIEGGKTIQYRNSTVLGNYNNDGFVLTIPDLPEHNYINVRFLLNIHDSWDGNPTGVGGPDIWWFTVSRGKKYAQRDYVFSTTFSNTPCDFEPYCKRQSYPNQYPFAISSRKGRLTTNRGLCHHADRSDGTTIYRIEQVIAHSGSELQMTFWDSLKQDNTADRLCDESWSIDNLEITAWE